MNIGTEKDKKEPIKPKMAIRKNKLIIEKSATIIANTANILTPKGLSVFSLIILEISISFGNFKLPFKPQF